MVGICAFCGSHKAEKRVEESFIHSICPDCRGVYLTPVIVQRKPDLGVLVACGAHHTACAQHGAGLAACRVKVTADAAAAKAAAEVKAPAKPPKA
jgi:hypothetical protein